MSNIDRGWMDGSISERRQVGGESRGMELVREDGSMNS